MTTNTFIHKDVVAGTSRTLIYGPVAAGVTSIVFSGTFANVDSSAKVQHTITVELLNSSSTYVPVLKDIPVPYGSSSDCPKIVLMAGESLYLTADAVNVVQGSLAILERV